MFHKSRLLIGDFDDNATGRGKVVSIDGECWEGVFDYGELMSGRHVGIDGTVFDGEFMFETLYKGVARYTNGEVIRLE